MDATCEQERRREGNYSVDLIHNYMVVLSLPDYLLASLATRPIYIRHGETCLVAVCKLLDIVTTVSVHT